MILETDRLLLSKFTAEDTDNMSSLLMNADVMKYYPKTLNKQETEEFLVKIINEYKDNKASFWKMTMKQNKDFAGQAGILYRQVEDEWLYMLGYMIKKEYWGLGLAFEKSKAIFEYNDKFLKIPDVVTLIRPENTQSIRVAEKLKLKYVKQVNYFGYIHNYYIRIPDIPVSKKNI